MLIGFSLEVNSKYHSPPATDETKLYIKSLTSNHFGVNWKKYTNILSSVGYVLKQVFPSTFVNNCWLLFSFKLSHQYFVALHGISKLHLVLL